MRAIDTVATAATAATVATGGAPNFLPDAAPKVRTTLNSARVKFRDVIRRRSKCQALFLR